MPEVRSLLCAFHVKIAWARGLREKVPDEADRKRLKDGLERLMRMTPAIVSQSTEQNRVQADAELQRFYAINSDQVAFVEYFKREWVPKIGE